MRADDRNRTIRSSSFTSHGICPLCPLIYHSLACCRRVRRLLGCIISKSLVQFISIATPTSAAALDAYWFSFVAFDSSDSVTHRIKGRPSKTTVVNSLAAAKMSICKTSQGKTTHQVLHPDLTFGALRRLDLPSEGPDVPRTMLKAPKLKDSSQTYHSGGQLPDTIE